MSDAGSAREAPEFLTGPGLPARAYAFASAAYATGTRRSGAGLEHPVAVAVLVHEHADDEEVVAAAVLHDTLEDTTVTRGELESAFGARVAGLVAHLSEDESIAGYGERKAHLRRQVASAGETAALIFLADKLARLRTGAPIDAEKLAHYRLTVAMLSKAYPELPFIVELRHALRNRPPAADASGG